MNQNLSEETGYLPQINNLPERLLQEDMCVLRSISSAVSTLLEQQIVANEELILKRRKHIDYLIGDYNSSLLKIWQQEKSKGLKYVDTVMLQEEQRIKVNDRKLIQNILIGIHTLFDYEELCGLREAFYTTYYNFHTIYDSTDLFDLINNSNSEFCLMTQGHAAHIRSYGYRGLIFISDFQTEGKNALFEDNIDVEDLLRIDMPITSQTFNLIEFAYRNKPRYKTINIDNNTKNISPQRPNNYSSRYKLDLACKNSTHSSITQSVMLLSGNNEHDVLQAYNSGETSFKYCSHCSRPLFITSIKQLGL